MPFVLRAPIASRRRGRDVWFREMTAIGPRTTANIDERAVFDTRVQAAMHPANRHMLAIFEVEEIENDG